MPTDAIRAFLEKTALPAWVLILNILILVLNVLMLFSAYTKICDESDVEMKQKPSRFEFVNKMRGSFLLSGALLTTHSYARICMPGGCPIGARPVDLHLKGFSELGAEISQGHGYIDLYAKKLHGAKIYLDFPSVGATENLIMAATLADGETVIENAAAEPEIEDLSNFLNKQGAKITGAGSDTVRIEGVESLSGCRHTLIPDRIEAGTYMTAIAITRGKGLIKNVCSEHMSPMLAKLREMNVEIAEEESGILIDAAKELVSTDIKTMPFPGFPTDMQAQFGGLLTTAKGTGVIVETVFENRFLHTGELKRMGANIKIDGRTAVVEGVDCLTGTKVNAADVRGGAARVIAGLSAKGETEINGVEHIKRGYEHLAQKLRGMGADISEEN